MRSEVNHIWCVLRAKYRWTLHRWWCWRCWRSLHPVPADTTDGLEERVKAFFGGAKKLKPAEREAEYEAIRRDYYKTLEDSGGSHVFTYIDTWSW